MKKVKFLRLKFKSYEYVHRRRKETVLRPPQKAWYNGAKDIDGVLDFIYSIASIAVDIAEKENKHPE